MIKKRSKKIFISLVMMLLSINSTVFATQWYKVNGGNSVAINEWGICRRVTNASGWSSVFVPTNTSAEWAIFINNKPNQVTLNNCLPSDAVISIYERSCGATPHTWTVGSLLSAPGTFTTSTDKHYTISIVNGAYVKIDCWRSPAAPTPGLNVVAVGLTTGGTTYWASSVIGYTLGFNGIAESAVNALGPPSQVGPYTYVYNYYGKNYYYTDCTWMGDTSSSLTVWIFVINFFVFV